MDRTMDRRRSVAIWFPAAIARWTGLLVMWLLIAGASPADLAVGLIAAGLATWASLILPPAGMQRVRPAPLIHLGVSVLCGSVVAGFDVARRAFDPRLPLNPGVVRYRSGLPAGPARAAFGTITSLVPGTLPMVSAPDGALLVHCLDIGQPIADGLARDETLLLSALSLGQVDG